MKISKFARQNYILLALSGIFALIAKGGIDDVAKNNIEGVGVFFILIGGVATLAFLTALVVRLWDME